MTSLMMTGLDRRLANSRNLHGSWKTDIKWGLGFLLLRWKAVAETFAELCKNQPDPVLGITILAASPSLEH